MDTISIRNLRVATHIGVTEEERSEPQWVLVSVDLQTDLRPAAKSDDLEDTVNYHWATNEIAAIVRSSKCQLLEYLAGKIASQMSRIERVDGVTVEVAKESPPVEEDVGGIVVRIERT
ncbi:MAG: dihydroneopterin aldolase [Actinobacteria bacterium]|jgi:dihydroneopterin aldolase|nr:dihydroneopterin aldolase [Actinomycetota bacterium]